MEHSRRSAVDRVWDRTLMVSPAGYDQCSWFSQLGSLCFCLVVRRIGNSHKTRGTLNFCIR
jgi:hypothetical protein